MWWLSDVSWTWLMSALACYGLASAGYACVRVARRFLWPRDLPVLRLIALVQDQERQVEGFVRAFTGMIRRAPREGVRYELTIVDLTSTDTTWAILEKLVREEPAIRLVRIAAHELDTVWATADNQSPGCLSVFLDIRTRSGAAAALRLAKRFW